MKTRRLALLCCFSILAFVTACGSSAPRNGSVGAAPVAASNAVQFGTVSHIDVVAVESRTSGGGALLGAVLGGVIGHQVGGGTGQTVATGIGAVGGAVIGNQVEKHNKSDNDVYRISVRYDNGRVEKFDYERIEDLRVGDRVKVQGGQVHRV
jgi:outer membrane lipoprotein SlyB